MFLELLKNDANEEYLGSQQMRVLVLALFAPAVPIQPTPDTMVCWDRSQ